MKITLITVCFNSAAVIRTALESVLAQKGADYEYIVMDGASADGTVDILRVYAPKFAGRMRWVSGSDKGMYDAMNSGIRLSTGDVIGLLNADDALASDDVLLKVAAAFESDSNLDGTYADIRFVRDLGRTIGLSDFRALPTFRYCTGRYFRPWMFRFGTQTAHPSTFFRRACFARWGLYSLDYGMFGDFELLLRFIWKNRARMRYLPLCTTVMRAGGASTNGWASTKKINETDCCAIRDNGFYTNIAFLYFRYVFKIWGFVFKQK